MITTGGIIIVDDDRANGSVAVVFTDSPSKVRGDVLAAAAARTSTR
jgi:hypothetical protein